MRLEFQEQWGLVLLGGALGQFMLKLKLLKFSGMLDHVLIPLKLLVFEPVITVASGLDNKNN